MKMVHNEVWVRPLDRVVFMPHGHVLPCDKRLKLLNHVAQMLRAYWQFLIEGCSKALPQNDIEELQGLLRDVGERTTAEMTIAEIGGMAHDVPSQLCKAEADRVIG